MGIGKILYFTILIISYTYGDGDTSFSRQELEKCLTDTEYACNYQQLSRNLNSRYNNGSQRFICRIRNKNYLRSAYDPLYGTLDMRLLCEDTYVNYDIVNFSDEWYYKIAYNVTLQIKKCLYDQEGRSNFNIYLYGCLLNKTKDKIDMWNNLIQYLQDKPTTTLQNISFPSIECCEKNDLFDCRFTIREWSLNISGANDNYFELARVPTDRENCNLNSMNKVLTKHNDLDIIWLCSIETKEFCSDLSPYNISEASRKEIIESTIHHVEACDRLFCNVYIIRENVEQLLNRNCDTITVHKILTNYRDLNKMCE